MKIEITKNEAELLADILESFEGNLRVEIRRTDDAEYKDYLHQKMNVIDKVLKKCLKMRGKKAA